MLFLYLNWIYLKESILCTSGTTDPDPCIMGHYCPQGTGLDPIPCPINTYLNETGASVEADCKSCEKGYICNMTGMTDSRVYPCPAGFYCTPREDPKLCPAGRMRNETGAGDPTDCPLCRPGYYCPNDTINLHGIPCRAEYYCPEGSSLETICLPGYYCESVTGIPPICPPGYYCPTGTQVPIECQKPAYCPEGSNMTMYCPLGYQAQDHSGIRYDASISCRVCPPGTYGNHTDRSVCESCPPGFYCPEGTGHGDSNPCRIGSYCPVGSHVETPCPGGTYGTLEIATTLADCTLCPANTYSNAEFAIRCEPCGGTSESAAGSTSCTCKGKYRSFGRSYKTCTCLAGYIYYDELDNEKSDLDGDEDCQLISDPRCSTNQVRDPRTRQCIDPNTVDCDNFGGCDGTTATFDRDYGRCFCDSYVSESTICDSYCQGNTAPTISGSLQIDGTFAVSTYDPVTGSTTTQTMPNMFGPSEAYEGITSPTILVVSFWGHAVTGVIYPDASTAEDLFKTLDQLSYEAGGIFGRRRLLATLKIPSNQITSPVMCVESGEMVIFKILINTTDRSLSNYPKYNKDHLFSTNPTFDYGAFTALQYEVENTNANISTFAHVFDAGGNYVFYDAQDPTMEVLIRVEPAGSTCSSSRIKPATQANIMSLGFAPQDVTNQAPDWTLIIGIIAFFATLCLLLVIAIIIWLPKHAGIHPMLHWAPKYRSLGKPSNVPHYIRYDPDHWPDKPMESEMRESFSSRAEGDGAEADLMTAPSFEIGAMKSSENDLEDFNVRVLYDKLEDQNLHLAAQLARQQEDLRNFYNKIQEQNKGLRDLLMNMDPVKLEELERRLDERQKARVQEGLHGAAGDVGPTIVNATIGLANANKHRFAGAGGGAREDELMVALQILLERLNSGTLPISKSMYEQLQKGGTGDDTTTTTTVNYHGQNGSGLSKAFAELLRRQNAERLRLERDLLKEEQDVLSQLADDEDAKRQEVTEQMADKLASDLHGADNAAEIANIMNKYSKDLDGTMNKYKHSRDRQTDELHRKLALRRQAREQALREKQKKEAIDAGLPLPPDPADMSDVKLRTNQSTMDTLVGEEAAATAKLNTGLENDLGNEERRQLCDRMREHMDRMAQQGIITPELRGKLMQQHRESELALQKTHETRRQNQLRNLQEKMAQRRKKRFDRLRDEQEKYKNDLTAKLIEEGHNDDLERELAALQRLFDQEMAAAEAEMDAEENEHVLKLSKTVSDDHTTGLKEKQRALLKLVSDGCPATEQVALQRLMDQYRKDQESMEQELSLEKERQLGDLRAKLLVRRNRRTAESQRKLEEDEAQRVIAEQRKQMQQQQTSSDGRSSPVAMDTGLLRTPKVDVAAESMEEKAVKKEQERNKDDLRKQQKKDFDQTAAKLDAEAQKQEDTLKNQLNSDRDKRLRELKSKQAAELTARTDLSQDQINTIRAQHEHDLEELADRLENEKNRQVLALQEKLASRRLRKLEDLRRKQDVDRTKEMLEQKKELDDIRLKKAKEMEREAIKTGIKDNGQEDSERVIKAVLAQRQAKELGELEKEFAAKKRMMVDDALNRLNEKYDKMRDDMMRRHDQELADLMKQGLSPEELAAKRADLLNRQQQELAALDRQHANEKGDVERGALADWELQFAKAKLALKEKHYKEFADALREFTDDKSAAENAEQNAGELEDMKRRLENERKQQEAKMMQEQQDFEKEEMSRMEKEMAKYAQQLEKDTKQEKEKHERNLDALNKRKEDLIKERRSKMKEEVDRLKTQGASEDDQKQLLEQHEKDLQNLLNKIDADKMRMQSTLQERLKKKKLDRLLAKEKELKENTDENKREFDHKQNSQIQRMKADEALTLNEALNIDSANARMESNYNRPQSPVESSRHSTVDDNEAPERLPSSYNMAAPLNDAELVALLMASPLYQKLENIKSQIEKGAHKAKADKSDGDVFHDAKDSEWTGDGKLEPLDLNKLDARKFIVYKFGCFVTDLVATHCQHAPVTLLLADKIPANERLRNNAYRNSFSFDANNKILYIRAARLDTVGEFVVVLVHTLAHIKAGDLRNDHNPDFLREYHRALAVVCDDLFFARFRRNTAGTIRNEPSVDGAVKLLQQMFGNCHTEDEKIKMVDDLLDVKLLPSTTSEGVHFNAERLKERLSQYSSFSMTNKLHTMLGSMEDKVHQAKSQGTTHHLDNSLVFLSNKYSPPGTCPINRKLPLRFVTANMTGHALWQTFANRAEADEPDQGEMPEPKSSQDQHDELDSDFADVNKSILEVKAKLAEVVSEVTARSESTEKGKGKKDQSASSQATPKANEKLASLKAELTKLEMEKQQILDRMNNV